MIALITGIVGIVATILAWNLNPKRKIYAELDEIQRQLEAWYEKRDKALVDNDSDTLTVATAAIVKLRSRKADLLQRLG
jgi:hypothetical protein